MKIGTMLRLNPNPAQYEGLIDHMVDSARRIEDAGFPSIWVGDSLGRGRPTIDPLVALGVLAATTRRVEIGVSVLQIPLRHPIELAHRVASVQKLSAGRLRLGVGSGSTRADFELLGYDFDHRFGAMKRGLAAMKQAWRGEPFASGGVLSTWPGCEGGPPILMGAWRSPRWITFAAQECAGWTPSGRYSSWDDLEYGMKIYREAGGTNAVLANVAIDLADRPGSAEVASGAHCSLICPPEEARKRLKRLKDIGFDEVLLISHGYVVEDLERARALV